jgi:YrbI family 3-deoxy-D-manno-octulosonate 8-phosphate phosphatase
MTVSLKNIDLVVFDFDGVMTDNSVWVMEDGRELVRCSRGDGWGLARLRDAGVEMLVLSTEQNRVVESRCEKLGVPVLYGVADKGTVLASLLADRRIDPKRVLYLGNDVNDAECLKLVGTSVVVADAHPGVMPLADLVLQHSGGHGAVRELCDLLLSVSASQ